MHVAPASALDVAESVAAFDEAASIIDGTPSQPGNKYKSANETIRGLHFPEVQNTNLHEDCSVFAAVVCIRRLSSRRPPLHAPARIRMCDDE
jgi:hypothetical protein